MKKKFCSFKHRRGRSCHGFNPNRWKWNSATLADLRTHPPIWYKKNAPKFAYGNGRFIERFPFKEQPQKTDIPIFLPQFAKGKWPEEICISLKPPRIATDRPHLHKISSGKKTNKNKSEKCSRPNRRALFALRHLFTTTFTFYCATMSKFNRKNKSGGNFYF